MGQNASADEADILMPGPLEIVEGRVEPVVDERAPNILIYLDVDGLQEILKKWLGKRVSIMIEEIEGK